MKVWWVSVGGDFVAVRAVDRDRAAVLVRRSGLGEPRTICSAPPGLEEALDVEVIDSSPQEAQRALAF
jgi:hypothetical protein